MRWSPRLLVAAFVLVSSSVRIYLAHTHYGFQTGDDLEVAEEAFRVAAGLAHGPWNIRSLLIPDVLVAPFVWLGRALGVRDQLLLVEIARYPFILLSALNIVLVYLLGRRWYDDKTGVVAAGLYAVHWMPLVYGSSLYPRTVAVSCVLGGAILLSARPGLAGLLAALAVTARYSEAIFLAPLLLSVERLRSRRTVALLGGFVAGVVVFVGLYDRISWGRWFGSLIHFAELTFVRRDAASLVVSQPPWWYVGNLLHWVPLTALPLFIVAVRNREHRRALVFVALPLLALSAIFHKELRYLQVIVPVVLLLAARGFTVWHEQPSRRRLAIALLFLSVPLAMSRIGMVRDRSTNALTAAVWMAERKPARIALSQAWAYGGRLFLGNEVEMADLDVPPRIERVRESAPRVAMLGVYSSEADDALRAACRAGGLTRVATFTDRGGRAVTVFHRPE